MDGEVASVSLEVLQDVIKHTFNNVHVADTIEVETSDSEVADAVAVPVEDFDDPGEMSAVAAGSDEVEKAKVPRGRGRPRKYPRPPTTETGESHEPSEKKVKKKRGRPKGWNKTPSADGSAMVSSPPKIKVSLENQNSDSAMAGSSEMSNSAPKIIVKKRGRAKGRKNQDDATNGQETEWMEDGLDPDTKIDFLGIPDQESRPKQVVEGVKRRPGRPRLADSPSVAFGPKRQGRGRPRVYPIGERPSQPPKKKGGKRGRPKKVRDSMEMPGPSAAEESAHVVESPPKPKKGGKRGRPKKVRDSIKMPDAGDAEQSADVETEEHDEEPAAGVYSPYTFSDEDAEYHSASAPTKVQLVNGGSTSDAFVTSFSAGKKGRGRPRKHQVHVDQDAPGTSGELQPIPKKRGRGRPKKNQNVVVDVFPEASGSQEY